MVDAAGRLPKSVLACVGGGSNCIGVFDSFIGDDVQSNCEAQGKTRPCVRAFWKSDAGGKALNKKQQ